MITFDARYLPTAGRPPLWGFFGCVFPAPLLYEAVRIAGLDALDHLATYNRADGGDIVSRAPATASAEEVDSVEWRMMNEKVDLFSPMVGLDFAVYRIPTRLVRERCNLGGPWGVRLGPRARGSLAQRLRDPKKMPPGTRKASPREGFQFSGNPLQMGYPASVNTDSRLGFSVAAYQSWGIAHDHCEAYRSTLVRIEGRLSKGRDG